MAARRRREWWRRRAQTSVPCYTIRRRAVRHSWRYVRILGRRRKRRKRRSRKAGRKGGENNSSYLYVSPTHSTRNSLACLPFPVNCPSWCAAGAAAAAATSRRFQRSCFSTTKNVFVSTPDTAIVRSAIARIVATWATGGFSTSNYLPRRFKFAAEIGGAARRKLLLLLLQNCFYCRALPRRLGAFRGRRQTVSRWALLSIPEGTGRIGRRTTLAATRRRKKKESADEKGEGGATAAAGEVQQQQQQWRSMGPLARHRALFTKGNDGVPFVR